MKHTITDENTLKAIAVATVEGTPFFVFEGKAYAGDVHDMQAGLDGWLEHMGLPLSATNRETYRREYIEAGCIPLTYDDSNYIALSDDEADEAAADYIRETLWAFNASFLADQTDLPEELFKAIQDNDKCEGNNDVILRLVEKCGDFDDFVRAAVSADGRGHFLASYDGEEHEVNMKDYTGHNEYYYVYRV